MINLLQENIKMKSHRTNSTFAITHKVFIFRGVRECFTFHTSQRLNQKLQKSYFFANAQIDSIFTFLN